jgi:hypothetical protein
VTISTCSYKLWRPDLGVPVRTSVGPPRSFPDVLVDWSRVWPPWSLVRAGLPEADYRRRYRHQLHRQTPAVLRELRDMQEGYDQPLCLLCHCDLSRPDGWCRRTMLGEWISEKLDVEIPELGCAR